MIDQNKNQNISNSPMVSLKRINHFYDKFKSLSEISFDINQGEIVSLLGPSGSGKTTMLRIIAGLEKPKNGELYLKTLLVSGDNCFKPPENRKIGFVFQDYALFPHLTVKENVLFALSINEKSKADKVLKMLDINQLSNSYPHEISGGQQQRVALARALAPEPDLILLDEPFTRLDIRLKEKLRDEILHLLKKTGSTALIVTHEAEEAMFMSDKIVVINEGKIMQIGRPSELYTRPISKFVAEFFGEVNYLSGTSFNGIIKTKLGNFPSDEIKDGLKAHIIIRHEGIKLEDNYSKKLPRAKVMQSRLLGRFSLVHLQVGEGKDKVHLHARVPGLSYLKPDTIIGIEIDPVQTYVFS